MAETNIKMIDLYNQYYLKNIYMYNFMIYLFYQLDNSFVLE